MNSMLKRLLCFTFVPGFPLGGYADEVFFEGTDHEPALYRIFAIRGEAPDTNFLLDEKAIN